MSLYVKHSDYDAQQRIKMAGTILRNIRKSRRLTQRDLAIRLNLEYYTNISQWENGTYRIPSEQSIPLAEVLKIDKSRWGQFLLAMYDPSIYSLCYGPYDGFVKKAEDLMLPPLCSCGVHISKMPI